MFQSVLKEDLIERLKVCAPCHRLDTVINRLSIDGGRTMYTSAEVLWIVQMIAEALEESAGKIVAKVRTAQEGEMDSRRETQTCEIWVDVFETEREAIDFCKGYKS